MLFNEELLNRIADDPVTGVLEAIALCQSKLNLESGNGWTTEEYRYLVETLALVEEVRLAGLLQHSHFPPEITGSTDSCPEISAYLNAVESHLQSKQGALQFAALRSRFGAALRSTFAYEFSDGDLSRIQKLISELREHINVSTLFDPAHQRRLLMRLEKLQAEMHKRVSDLDKFWGLVGDAGVALGKFGEDAKPMVDRIREITGIVWRTQARAEELPSDAAPPLLSGPDENSEHAE